MRIRPVLSLLALGLLLTQSAFALDLAEAYEKALSNDPNWANAQHTLDASEENTSLSRAYLLPSVDLNGNLTHNDLILSGTGDTLSYHQRQLGVKATQPLFRADAWYGYKQAKAATSAAEANFAYQKEQEILRVANAYFNVLSAQENLEYSKAEEGALGRQMDQSQQRFDVGLIAITDVLEAKAQFDAARASRISAEASLNTARENLIAIIGDDPGKLAPLKTDVPMNQPVPDNADEWTKLARDQNPQLLMAHYNYQGAKAATNVQRAAYVPNVDLFGQYNDTDIPNSGGNQLLQFTSGRTTTVGIQATWNLFGGGRTVASVRQASYQEAAAEDNVESVERNVVSTTRSAYLNVAANSFQVDATRQAVKSNESALAADQAGYEVGTRNIVDVLLTQSNLYAAKRDYANARYNYVINTLQLKAASGQLNDVDIRDLNNWLDPNGSITAAPEEPAPEPVTPAMAKPAKKH